MSRTSRAAAAALLLAVLTACAAPTPVSPTAAPATAILPTATPTAAPNEPVTITDGSGVELTFDAPPQRVVCLYTRCIEVLAAVGVTPIAVAGWIANVTTDPDYFPQPNEIVALRETNDDMGFDPEELAALEPDLVLGWEELRAPLEGIAPVHAVTNDLDSYQEANDEVRAFAQIFGREAEAEAAIQAFLDRLEAYKRLSPQDQSVINLFKTESIFYRDGQSGTCNLFKEVAGCDWPDPANASSWSVETSVEGLLQLNPDVILTSADPAQYPDEAALLADWGTDPLWHEISAFRNEQIIIIPATIYNMDGMGPIGATRMLDYFLPRIYPEVFPAALTDAQVQAALGQ